MNLRTLPPSMLLALGLACGGDDDTSSDTRVDACLSPPPPETTTGPCLSTSFGPDTGIVTGPCLEVPLDSSSGGSSGSGTGTGTGTGSGSGTGSDSGSESGTAGMGVAPAESRADALQRVLDRGTLPSDVADRLQKRRG